jgi:hypothetical protein
MIRPAAALALFLSVPISTVLHAEEAAALDYSAVPAPAVAPSSRVVKAYPATVAGWPTGKVIFEDSTSDVSVAMCGIEGHGTAVDLDAGLIDFNVPDPARAAGGAADAGPKDVGRSQYDYRSSIVLGVTLGYRF